MLKHTTYFIFILTLAFVISPFFSYTAQANQCFFADPSGTIVNDGLGDTPLPDGDVLYFQNDYNTYVIGHRDGSVTPLHIVCPSDSTSPTQGTGVSTQSGFTSGTSGTTVTGSGGGIDYGFGGGGGGTVGGSGGGITGSTGGVPSQKFSIGDTVVSGSTLNVRSSANGTLIGSVPTATIGVVQAGPVVAGAYTWWKVNFNNGMLGWSVQDWLAKISNVTPQNPQDPQVPTLPDTGTTGSTGGTSTGGTTVDLKASINERKDWYDAPVSNPLVITADQMLYMTWTATNATACAPSAPIADIQTPVVASYFNGNTWIQFAPGSMPLRGGPSHYPSVGQTITYTITCTGPNGGSASDTVTIQNAKPSLSKVDLKVNGVDGDLVNRATQYLVYHDNVNLKAGDPLRLSWEIVGGAECQLYAVFWNGGGAGNANLSAFLGKEFSSLPSSQRNVSSVTINPGQAGYPSGKVDYVLTCAVGTGTGGTDLGAGYGQPIVRGDQITVTNGTTNTTVPPQPPTNPITPILPPKIPTETGGTACLILTTQILEGSSGSEVTALQDFLRTQGFFTANSTGFFGPVTAKSVSAFQEANGLESVGSVGPKTRAKIQSISCGTNSSVVTTPINTGSGSTNTTGTVGSGIQVTIKAKPPMATTGETSTLVWSAPNALSCNASGAWSGPRGPVGEQIIGPLYSAGKYELTCRSETTSGYASVQVSVQAGDAPTTGTTGTPVTNTNTGSANTNTNTNTGSTNTSSGAIGSNTPVVNGVADLKISTDGVNFTDGPISFAYRDRLWFKWTSTISGNACSVPTPPESGGVINTFMGSNFANYTFGPVSAGTNGFPYSADALSIRYNLVCNRGIYDGNVVLADYVTANFVGQNPVSTAIAAECTNLFVGNPTVNGPTPGYPWGTMYMSGNPRWREIEWRIQNGITLLPSDLGKYYTEYMTAMGLSQNLRNLLRPDGTPFAGPGGLVVPQNASVTNATMFPTYNRSSGVFDYQANIGFVGSQQGASTEAWFSPFSSATRVACPLATPLN